MVGDFCSRCGVRAGNALSSEADADNIHDEEDEEENEDDDISELDAYLGTDEDESENGDDGGDTGNESSADEEALVSLKPSPRHKRKRNQFVLSEADEDEDSDGNPSSEDGEPPHFVPDPPSISSSSNVASHLKSCPPPKRLKNHSGLFSTRNLQSPNFTELSFPTCQLSSSNSTSASTSHTSSHPSEHLHSPASSLKQQTTLRVVESDSETEEEAKQVENILLNF